MKRILTGTEMKEADSFAIRRMFLNEEILIERAALHVADLSEEMTDAGDRILVLCGRGNNGADGCAAARLLSERGRRAEILQVFPEGPFSEGQKKEKQICEAMGIPFVSRADWDQYALIIDAVYGIGCSREITGEAADLIVSLNGSGKRVLCVDIPSGIHSDTGEIMGTAVRGSVTVTFSYLKRGALLFPGREFCGKLMLKNAGIFRPDDLGKAFDAPAPFPRETEAGLFLPEKEDMASLLPPRGMRSHKGTYGRTVLFAGSEDMPGAARMAAEAAYRSGTGLVQICSSASNRAVFTAALPEAVFTCEEKLRSEDYMNSVLEKAGAVLLGSGWGLREDALKILEYVLKTYRGTIVLDADALNLISAFGWPERRTEDEQRVIITPHLLEMSRLSDKDPGYIQSHLTETAESYAREHKVICVLKDATSIVTDGSRSFLITSGCGGMSTGGSGDVLAGLTAGIAAQRTGPLESAVSGAFLHGLAGTKAAVSKGQRGMLAGDIIAEIPYVLKELEK